MPLLIRLCLTLMLPLLCFGCGTATFSNTFSVSIDDPAGVLGESAEPVEVSVFDPLVGSTRDWARQSMGTAGPQAPYLTSVPSTETKVLGDNSPPETIRVALAIPAYSDKGYFGLTFSPRDGTSQEVTSAFVPYDQDGSRTPKVAPPTLTISSVEEDDGWLNHVVVHIPQAAS